MGLEKYTTTELLDEIGKRFDSAEATKSDHWCDDCLFFAAKENAGENYNPCKKKKKMEFKAPDEWSDVDANNYGFFNCKCTEFVKSSPVRSAT
jgi:hypothetical protein